MNKVMLILLSLLFIGCKTDDKIEIYLLKRRVELKNEYLNYDTVSKTAIKAGRFEVQMEDLQQDPFISDQEIISFNLKNNKFIFTPPVVKRMESLPGNMHDGTQFVVTVNRKSQLTGYFMHMSVWCDWYYMRFFKEGEGSAKENKTSFELFNGYMRGKHEDLTPPYPKELLEAFRSSNRLIE